MKDLLLSKFGEWLIKRHVAPYGRVTDFQLDTVNKKIALTAELRGESSPIRAVVSYVRQEQDGGYTLFITGVEVSRPWLQDLASAVLLRNPQSIAIPPGLLTTAVRVLKI